MTTPLISVIIPAYNHECYVQHTINSIIEQTYPNIELIIVNDGSKDMTWDKINEMKVACEARFARVVFQTQENQGTCKTLNTLIGLAQGEFIYLIASDDMAKPHAIAVEYDFLSQNDDYALCVGDDEFIDAHGKRCYWDKEQNNVYSENEAIFKTFGTALQQTHDFSKGFGTYSSLVLSNYIPNGYLIRKSIFEKTGRFLPEAPLEDWWLMLQISKYAKMHYIDDILFSYRWHGANTAKDREKMERITKQTREYEKQYCMSLDYNTLAPEIVDVIKNGVITKIQGLSFLLQVVKRSHYGDSYKQIKLFGIPIFSYKKRKKK